MRAFFEQVPVDLYTVYKQIAILPLGYDPLWLVGLMVFMKSLSVLKTSPGLVDQVYRALLDAICDGSLPPDERLTQEVIAQRLGVSRQPVLQALRQLKLDGFVTESRGRGLVVKAIDSQWLSMVYQVRGALDALAARLAAQHRAEIDPGLLERGRQAAKGQDVQAMIDADLAFHQAIYDASRNPLIGQIAGQHWQHLRRAMGAVLQRAEQRHAVWDEHDAIVQAIAKGMSEQAARLVEMHTQRAGSMMTEHLRRTQAA